MDKHYCIISLALAIIFTSLDRFMNASLAVSSISLPDVSDRSRNESEKDLKILKNFRILEKLILD
jgi:hypothetical protein